jgi:hypothetical protein
MKRFMLLGLALGVILLTTPATGDALPAYCHASDIFHCLGEATVLGTNLTFEMSGGDALALVDAFSAPSKSRNVTWTNFEMQGLTKDGAEITASLDQSRESSGTLLSVGNAQFPATATMRFFLRLETGGMTLVSTEPAVFQGIINSIPPSPGDSLALISGPVRFQEEGGSRATVGTLNKSRVVYHERQASLPAKAEWGMAGFFGAVLLVSGGLYARRRTLVTE